MNLVPELIKDRGIARWTLRLRPTCRAFVHGWEKGEPERTCDRPATERVHYWPHWSENWCPEHAAAFRTEKAA